MYARAGTRHWRATDAEEESSQKRLSEKRCAAPAKQGPRAELRNVLNENVLYVCRK